MNEQLDSGSSPQVLCVDPGKTTGLAWASILWATHKLVIDERFAGQCAYGQIGGADVTLDEQTYMIVRGIIRVDARIVVCESSDHFLLRQGSALRKDSLIPIELTAKIEYAVHVLNTVHGHQIKFMKQTPAQAKGVLTDARMQALGLKLPRAERHSMDALRHLILMLRRMKEKPELLDGVRTI